MTNQTIFMKACDKEEMNGDILGNAMLETSLSLQECRRTKQKKFMWFNSRLQDLYPKL